MRCNILRRPAFPGGNLKEKQFHIKLSDTMQVGGVGEGGAGRRVARKRCGACVWMVGGVRVGVLGSFLTAIGRLERDTHILSAELKGMEWMKFQSLPCRHTLCFAHISNWDVQIFNSVVPAWFHLLYASIRHGSAVINEKTNPPPSKKKMGSTCMCVCVCVCACVCVLLPPNDAENCP